MEQKGRSDCRSAVWNYSYDDQTGIKRADVNNSVCTTWLDQGSSITSPQDSKPSYLSIG